MTIDQLYEKLTSERFMNPKYGDMFYNYYIYPYDIKEEYEKRLQIAAFKEKLKRPTSYINALTLDLFEVFCEFLDAMPFGKAYPSMKQFLMDIEATSSKEVQSILTEQACSDEFLQYVQSRILEHINQGDGLRHPYVFIYGMGEMFPYLRTNVFLTKYEKYNQTNLYKIIVFYPGSPKGNSFSLFDMLDDTHTYRAILLLNEENL